MNIDNITFERENRMKGIRAGRTALKKRSGGVLAAICALGMLAVICCGIRVQAAAAEDTFEGYGLQYDPYLIASYDDICALRDLVDEGNNLAGIYFKQTQDIELKGKWDPIGDIEEGKAFCGYYDGNGHTLSGISCEDTYAGLFANLEGEVRNLGIESGTFAGSWAGSIASRAGGAAKIINCYNKAEVSGTERAGGIADELSGVLLFCVNMGNVSAGSEAGAAFGLCTIGAPYIAYSYDVGNGRLTDETGFTGSIAESAEIAADRIPDALNSLYEGMWTVYRSKGKLENRDTLVPINRGNTVFMRCQDGDLRFDPSYEPAVFCAEKEKNKERFLSIYRERYAFDGEGTKEHPFLIKSYEDLSRFRDCVDIGLSYRDYYFEQTEDIRFPEGQNWNGIGDVKGGRAFAGIYDGHGHCIYDIYCDEQYAGLFSLLWGEVRNLGIESGSFKGEAIGSITSHGRDGARIVNCYNKAQVTGDIRASGIADNFPGEILFCWNFGKVSGTKSVTTLAGICSFGAGDVEYCYTMSGKNPVCAPSFFSGKVVHSYLIDHTDIRKFLDKNYQECSNYISSGMLKMGEIIFPVLNKGTFTFNAAYVPLQIKRNQILQNLPEYILYCFGVIIGILTLIIVWPKRNIHKQMITKEIEKSDRICRYGLKNVVAFLLVSVILLTSLYHINALMRIKHLVGVEILNGWEKEENKNTDVLFIGSSTSFVNIEQSQIWQEYGISSYCLGGAGARIVDNYYKLIEAEKVRDINMVVLDVRACAYTEESHNDGIDVANISALKYSLNKFHYVQAEIDPKYRIYYFLEFPVNHDRYNSLNKNDFLYTSNSGEHDKGTALLTKWNNYWPEIPSSEDLTDYRALDEKIEYYFRKIIEFCQSKDVPLLLIKTPEVERDYYEPAENSMELIAQEYNVPFLNLNLYDKQTGIVSSDFYDKTHLTFKGARKCSDFLGKYLTTHYDLVDHRGDPAYKSWDMFSAYRENMYLQLITNNKDYFTELQRDNKTVMVVPYKLPKESSKAYLKIQRYIHSIHHFDWDKEDVLYGEENAESFVFGDNEITITKDYDNCEIKMNGDNLINVSKPGYLFIVYDNVNDKIADIAEFERDSGYTIRHLYDLYTSEAITK